MTDQSESAWQVVASLAQVRRQGMHDIVIGRNVVLLIADTEQVRAVQGLCPHQRARLSDGVLAEGVLQCPHHLARFNLSDGTCTGGWQLPPLRRYDVRVEGDDVLLPNPLVALE